MSNSERLRQKTELLAPALATPGRLLLQHSQVKKLVPEFLLVGYDINRTSVPLMEAVLERTRSLAAHDPVAGPLAEYLERHIVEETHGDEAGGEALEDLAAIGVDTSELPSRPPVPKVAALIGLQYFLAFQYHPVSIVGFLQLEQYHPRRERVEELIEASGLPRQGFSQMLLHSELDLEHAEELDALLDLLPLTADQEELVGLSALRSMALVTEIFLDVVQHAGSSSPAGAGLP